MERGLQDLREVQYNYEVQPDAAISLKSVWQISAEFDKQREFFSCRSKLIKERCLKTSEKCIKLWSAGERAAPRRAEAEVRTAAARHWMS